MPAFHSMVKHLVFATILWGAMISSAQAQQTEISSIPVASSAGVISVCAGSTILFDNETNLDILSGATTFNWDFGNDSTATTVGPHAITYDEEGTYLVSLAITTFDGFLSLGSASFVVQVAEDPPFLPELGPGNSCTVMYDSLGTVTFQTQSGSASCLCTENASNMGPAISLLGTNNYPENTISTIWWGGAGNLGNGATFPFTTQTGNLAGNDPFPTEIDSLSVFVGQSSNWGHYTSQGSYNLMHVVTFPDGCVFSSYYVMSWGAALIDFCANNAQSLCFPLDYALCFGSQAPGTTYYVDWGDGTDSTFSYPNLPNNPNVLGHLYSPSCVNDSTDATDYTITVTAVNNCPTDNPSVNSQGPFYVSTQPSIDFEADPGLQICEGDSITFSEMINPGFEASPGGQCSDDHFFAWTVQGSSSFDGPGYEVVDGVMGDLFGSPSFSGSDNILIIFEQPGTYDVAISGKNNFCSPTDTTKTVIVYPRPEIEDIELTICNGEIFVVNPPDPPNTVPPGTTYEWSVVDNPMVTGEVNGNGSSITGVLENLSNVTQTVVYTVVPTAPPNCIGEPFVLTVNVVSGIIIPDVELTVCNGLDVSYLPSDSPPMSIIPEGTTYTWTFVDNPNVTGESEGVGVDFFSQVLLTSTFSPPQQVVYEVTASSGQGCDDEVFLITIYINNVDVGLIADNELVCAGGDPSMLYFDVPVQASGEVSYQWQSAPSQTGLWIDIVGATSSIYDPPSGVISDDTYYRVVVTSLLNGVSCVDSSNVVLVEVNYLDQPEIGSDQLICEGGDPSEIAILGNLEAFWDVSFQWEESTDSLIWTPIAGAESDTFDPPPPIWIDTWYRVIVTSNAESLECFQVSESVFVDVNSINPGSIVDLQTICVDDIPGPLQVVDVVADGEISYIWYSSDNPDGPFIQIGDNSDTYVSLFGLSQDTYYLVEVISALEGLNCFE